MIGYKCGGVIVISWSPFPRCDLVDTWWQTETGGVAIAPRPAEEGAEIIAGKPMRPMLGMQVSGHWCSCRFRERGQKQHLR